jgi:acetyltransferase-like isoleucine patch superfamily enzyme
VWAFAHVLAGARVGTECNICDHAYVESGAVVGDRVTLKNGVLIFDHVVIDDDVFVGPAAVFTNDLRPRAAIRRTGNSLVATHVKRGASIGAGAVVVCGNTIGEFAFIGAGAVVVADVPAHGFVVGNPARPIGWACRCGERLPESLRCGCGLVYEHDYGGLHLAEAGGVA